MLDSLSLLSLPQELQLHILSFVPLRSLFAFQRSCAYCNALSKDMFLWRGNFLVLKGKEDPEDIPSPRLCASSVIYRDKLVVLGGDSGGQVDAYINDVKSDVWTFDIKGGKWTRTPSLNNSSTPITEHTAVLHGNDMYYFGGCKDQGYMNNLSKYSISSGIYEPMYTSVSRPAARSAHSAVVYNNSMYIFGGWSGSHSYGDFTQYNFEENKWSNVEYTGIPPSRRRAHCAVVHRNYMYLFGGYDSENEPSYYNKMHKYNFETKHWDVIKLTGEVPSGRSRCSMVAHNGRLYILGGWNRKDYFCDLFEIDTKTWKCKAIKNNLTQFMTGIGQHSCVVYKGWLMVFGGYIAGKNICSNDIFMLKLV